MQEKTTTGFELSEYPPREDEILERAGSSNGQNELIEGFGPITWACWKGSLGLVEQLVDLGCSVRLPNSDGTTALFWSPTLEITRFLVKMGAKVSDERPQDGILSLHRVTEKGHHRLAYLLEHSDARMFIESTDFLGRTPLGYAVTFGNQLAVLSLLQNGADPNGCDETQLPLTPLQHAVVTRNLELVECLLKAGASHHLNYRMTDSYLMAKEAGVAAEYARLVRAYSRPEAGALASTTKSTRKVKRHRRFKG